MAANKEKDNRYLEVALDLYNRHIISSRMAAKLGGVSHATIIKMANKENVEKEGKDYEIR